MRSRSPLSNLAERGQRFADEISSTIVAVKSASERGRAESIRDVVDAYRRLYGSVQRFILMLTDDQLNFASVGTSGSHSLNQLLSILAEQARGGGLRPSARAQGGDRRSTPGGTTARRDFLRRVQQRSGRIAQGGGGTRTARRGLYRAVRRPCAGTARTCDRWHSASRRRPARNRAKRDGCCRRAAQSTRRARPRPLERLIRRCRT